MRGPLIHGALLIGMLLFAYQTWTRDKSVKQSTGRVEIWNERLADLKSITYETPERTAKLERRGDGVGYFWGTDTKMTKKPKPKAVPPDAGVPADGGVPVDGGVPGDAGAPPTPPPAPDAGTAEPEFETTTTVREFPVGEVSITMLPAYAAMRAQEDHGILTEDKKTEYKLTESDKTLTVVFASGTHTFVIGDKVPGGKHRYALDVGTGKGYVLDGSLISPLEEGESGLKPKKIIPTGDHVTQIDFKAGDKTKSVSWISVEDQGKVIKTWGDPVTRKADQNASNFLTKVETGLKVDKYEPELDIKTLTSLMTVTYRDAKGGSLGELTLYKREVPAEPKPGDPPSPTPPPPVAEYFVVTSMTRVPAAVPKTAGDQVEQNIAPIFE